MVRKVHFATTVLFFTVSFGLLAQTHIRVEGTGRPGGKVGIDLGGVDTGRGRTALIGQTLAADLNRSGWFVVSPNAGIQVSGAVDERGSNIRMRCRVARVGGQTLLDETFSGEAGRERPLAHEVADAIVKAVTGKPGIASTRIAFVGSQNGSKDLYMCDADGANVRNVTKKGAVCLTPAWTPGGDTLLFTWFIKGFPDVYKLDFGRRKASRFSGFPGLNAGADVAPDGRKVVLTLSKDGNPDLYIMGINRTQPVRMTRKGTGSKASPSWSPDGRNVVYVSDQSGRPQMYVMSALGGRGKRVTYRGTENVAPDWGSDGRIAYCSRRGGRYMICVFDPKTGRDEEVSDGGADYEDPSWAPDARHIVCTRTVSFKSDLYVLDTMGDPPVRLVTLPGDWYSAAWSPK